MADDLETAVDDYINAVRKLKIKRGPLGGLFFCCPPPPPTEADLKYVNNMFYKLTAMLTEKDLEIPDTLKRSTNLRLKKLAASRNRSTMFTTYIGGQDFDQIQRAFDKYHNAFHSAKLAKAEEARQLVQVARADDVGAGYRRSCALPMTDTGLVDARAMRRM
jgi:hypothetical protein